MTQPTDQPFDPNTLSAEPADMPTRHVTPNHHASAGTVADKPKRPGIFGGERSTKERPAKPTIANKPGQFVKPLTELYLGAALIAMPFDAELATIIMGPSDPNDDDSPSVAEKCAQAWDKAAQQSPAVRRMLHSLLTVSVWGALVGAHMPIMLVVMKNHSPLGEKFNPAAAMEAYLKRQAAEAEGTSE